MEEFTWLMINIPHLCSVEQCENLKSTALFMCRCY